jgi:hypothetical protein
MSNYTRLTSDFRLPLLRQATKPFPPKSTFCSSSLLGKEAPSPRTRNPAESRYILGILKITFALGKYRTKASQINLPGCSRFGVFWASIVLELPLGYSVSISRPFNRVAFRRSILTKYKGSNKENCMILPLRFVSLLSQNLCR